MADRELGVVLLRASPHERGAGKIHIFNGDKTVCGRTHAQCPGEFQFDGHMDDVTCLLCIRSHLAAIQQEERQEQWRQQREQWEAEQQYERGRREAEYQDYLEGPEWARLRTLVIERADGLCEGCGRARAVQAHHLTYDRIFREMLFDLVAVCRECHERIHRR